MDFQDVRETLKESGGFSLQVNDNQPLKDNNGYVVSITDNKVKENELRRTFRDLHKTAGKLNTDNALVGGWQDSEGNIYLDVSVKVDKLNEAKALGHLFNQKAIYDLKNNKSINLQ
jgi:hypothetical protein